MFLGRRDGDLDDVGVDPLSLVLFPILEPEIIKRDMSLVRDPHAAATERIAAAVREQAQRTGARIIAEGIETQDDFTHAVRLGAHRGQGWLFGRPAPIPPHDYAAVASGDTQRNQG